MECPEAMERGRNFRLLAEEELSELLDFLAGYLPESLKVRATLPTNPPTLLHKILLPFPQIKLNQDLETNATINAAKLNP